MINEIVHDIKEWTSTAFVDSPLTWQQNREIINILKEFNPKKISPNQFRGNDSYTQVTVTYTKDEVLVNFQDQSPELTMHFGMLRFRPGNSHIYCETPFKLFTGYSPHHKLSWFIRQVELNSSLPKITAEEYEQISHNGNYYPILENGPLYSGG